VVFMALNRKNILKLDEQFFCACRSRLHFIATANSQAISNHTEPMDASQCQLVRAT
jgi:hypothetical protein